MRVFLSGNFPLCAAEASVFLGIVGVKRLLIGLRGCGSTLKKSPVTSKACRL